MATKAPTVHMAGPSPFAKVFPKIVLTFELVAAIAALFTGALRMVWPYRVELATLAAPFVLAMVLTTMGSPASAALVTAGLTTVVALAWKRSRQIVVALWSGSRVIRQLIRVMQETRVANSSGQLPRVAGVRSTAVGQRVTIVLRAGQSAEALEQRIDEFRAGTKARDVRISRNSDRGNLATIDIVRRDAFADTPEIGWEDRDAEVLSMWDPVHLGIDENGAPVRLPLAERSLFSGGEPGAGKSSLLNVIASHAAKSPDAELILIDPNEVQFYPWKDRATAYAGDDAGDALAVAKLVQEEIRRRKQFLLSLSQQDDKPYTIHRKLTRPIAEEHGLTLWLFMIDELAYHTSIIGTVNGEFAKTVRDVVARGRAFGIIPVMATQRPTSDVVPTSLRDLFSLRYALRTTTQASSDVILGEGWARKGYSATDIDISTRGVGWLKAEGSVPKRVKSAWISDEQIADYSVSTVRYKPTTAMAPVIDGELEMGA